MGPGETGPEAWSGLSAMSREPAGSAGPANRVWKAGSITVTHCRTRWKWNETARTQEVGPEMMERKVQPRRCDQSLKNVTPSNAGKAWCEEEAKDHFRSRQRLLETRAIKMVGFARTFFREESIPVRRPGRVVAPQTPQCPLSQSPVPLKASPPLSSLIPGPRPLVMAPGGGFTGRPGGLSARQHFMDPTPTACCVPSGSVPLRALLLGRHPPSCYLAAITQIIDESRAGHGEGSMPASCQPGSPGLHWAVS